MTFDLTTIIITAAALGAVMGCVQWLAWLHVRSEACLSIWSGANFACAIGLALLALPGGLNSPLLPVANFWFLLATGLTYIGMCSFDREPAPPWVIALVVIVAAGAAILTWILTDAPLARRAVFSLVTVGWLGAGAWRLGRLPPTGPAFSRIAVALFLSVFCAMHLARLAATALGFTPYLAAPLGEQLSWLLLLSLVCGVGLNYGALFMVLDRLASRDELTGLSNRRALLRWGQTLLARAVKYRQPLSVMLVDLDHFKEVNDRFGHRVGDLVLEAFARSSKGALRPGDVIGRYGGEEFCVILPRTGHLGAAAAAERLRAEMQQRLHMVSGHETQVTVAVGIASMEADDPPFAGIDALIDAADHALYEAKDGGRNRVVAAPPGAARRTGAPSATTTMQPSGLH